MEKIDIVEKIVGQFAPNIRVCAGDGFYFYHILDMLIFQDQPPTEWDMFTDEIYNEVCHTLRADLPQDANMFVLSVLHEIGHYMVDDTQTEEDKIDVEFFNALWEITDDEEQEAFFYMMNPEERAATQWAVNTYMSKPAMMKHFDYLLKTHCA